MKNTWVFPFIESLHLAGMALLVGTVALPKSDRHLTRWSHLGLLVMLVTGASMFLADVERYTANPAFRVKMGFLALALPCHLALLRRAGWGKLFCVLLWTLVALAGRAIGDFDV